MKLPVSKLPSVNERFGIMWVIHYYSKKCFLSGMMLSYICANLVSKIIYAILEHGKFCLCHCAVLFFIATFRN
jgi:hypothetical protein